MRNENVVFFGLSGSALMVVGLVFLVFSSTIFAGLLLFLIGCLFSLSLLNKFQYFDFVETFFTVNTFLGLFLLLFFFTKGYSASIIYISLPLYALNFLFFVFNLDKKHKKRDKSKKIKNVNNKIVSSEKRVFKEVEKIYEDLEELKTDIKNIIVEEKIKAHKEDSKVKSKRVVKKDFTPKKEYLYVEGGKSFHLPGCIALSRTNKDKIKSFGQRSVAIRKGFKTCKACNS